MPLVVVGAASTAFATLLVPSSDEAMVARADDAVTGVVERVESVRLANGAIETWATVRVLDVLKGRRRQDRVVLRQPGGVIGDRAVVVLGTARVDVGDALLVVARRAPGGGHRPVGMGLGVYRLTLDGDGTAVAERVLGDRRELDDLVGAITAQAGAARRTLDDIGPVIAPFTFLGSPPGPPGRWFDFDRGLTVAIRSANGDADLGRTRSDTLLRRAFAGWTSVPDQTARLELGSDAPTGPSVAGGVCDGRSVAQFNDPADEMDDLFGCAGVLAVGGFCSATTAIGPDGVTFRVIAEGDLTVNRRIADCFSDIDVLEVLTHEVGHVLGLGHSSENASEPVFALRDATMFFLAHFDGRGAAVRDDDVAGLRVLYPADDDGDRIPNALDQCPDTAAGHPVDETGCACADPGHVACPSGDACTISRCDFDSARCVAEPVDCTGGDPCLQGSCTLTAGCTAALVEGYDAISCALERDFAPAACASDRIPRRFRRLVHRARRLVDKARDAAMTRQERRLDRAARKLLRALGRLTLATDPKRRRPLSPACADALGRLAEDARLRIESRGTMVFFDPTPVP